VAPPESLSPPRCTEEVGGRRPVASKHRQSWTQCIGQAAAARWASTGSTNSTNMRVSFDGRRRFAGCWMPSTFQASATVHISQTR
jgi:hypothetical protein